MSTKFLFDFLYLLSNNGLFDLSVQNFVFEQMKASGTLVNILVYYTVSLYQLVSLSLQLNFFTLVTFDGLI